MLLPGSHALMSVTARELSRYLYQLTGTLSPIIDHEPEDGARIQLASERPEPPSHLTDLSLQRCTILASDSGVTITGATPLGTLYGVYTLLEHLGVGFFLGGDTFPDTEPAITIEPGLRITAEPALAVRGSNLHGNLLAGASGWNENDWRFYIDQMARMRCNLFMLHIYSSEPGAGYEADRQLTHQGAPHSSLRPLFGIHPMRTSEFSFGQSVYFDQDVFGAPPVNDSDDPTAQALGMEVILRETIRYGRSRGVYAAVGFETPSRVDPTDSRVRRGFEERVRQFLRRYPDLAYLCLWQPESQGVFGEDIPKSRSAARLLAHHRDAFAYLWGPRRIYAGVHLAEFALLAHRVMREVAPNVRLVISGWGGDRWMRFADYARGLDQVLPKDIVLTCHENVDCTLTDTVSQAWGQLPPDRERWAQPWVESDGDECWTRQANVEPLSRLLPDALSKGCQGALALHWRTRDFEEELRYLARFSWQPEISTQEFYAECARLMFGPGHEKMVGEAIGDLHRLGGRWTGIHGGLECAPEFAWTGRKPHWPFELDAEAVHLVRAEAETAVAYLSEHGFRSASVAFARLAGELGNIANGNPRESVQMLAELEGEAFGIWSEMLAADPPLEAWGIVHGVAERLHYLSTRADHSRRTDELLEIRDRILRSKLGSEALAAPAERMERFAYLLNTMEVMLSLDRVSVALAEPGPVHALLCQAEAAAIDGNRRRAAQLGARVYEAIVGCDVRDMLEHQAAKLTTQCDWAVLALMHTKAMPAYWREIGRAEELMPVAPPRQVHLALAHGGVCITWQAAPSAAGYHVHRRIHGTSHFTRVTREPISTEQDWLPLWYPAQAGRSITFVDRPSEPGHYEYAVTAIDADRWESPRSHSSSIRFGLEPCSPRVLGLSQGFCLIAGQPHEVSVIVPPDHADEVAGVTLRWRTIGADRWQETQMLRRFRRSYHAAIPVLEPDAMGVEYHVEAVTRSGQVSRWPRGRPWTATILDPPCQAKL